MEHNWLETLTEDTKANFRAKRYMDDILLLYVTRADFQHEPFLENFCESKCYKPPLRLEKGGDNTFLETTFEITEGNQVRHWLKNENDVNKPPKIWRYAHYNSYGTYAQKVAVIMATLRKVHAMASDAEMRQASAIKKIAEFYALQYPRKTLWTACTTMAVTTRDPTWFKVRDLWERTLQTYNTAHTTTTITCRH